MASNNPCPETGSARGTQAINIPKKTLTIAPTSRGSGTTRRHARVECAGPGHRCDEVVPTQARRLHQRGQRQQDHQAQVGEGDAEREPVAGESSLPRRMNGHRAGRPAPLSFAGGVDLINYPLVIEVFVLGVLPTSEQLVDGEQLRSGRGQRGSPRAVVLEGGDPLAFFAVQELQACSATARVACLSTFLSTSATGGSARMLTDGTTISNWSSA